MLATLLGQPGARGRAALVQQDNGRSGRFGYRSGKWKLVRQPANKQPRKQASNRAKGQEPAAPPPRESLYDLDTDPGETTDVRARFPHVARRLAKELDAAIRAPAQSSGTDG